MANTEFENFLMKAIEEDRGRLVPVKASLWELMFKKKEKTEKLHPNPDDEFCDPKIGPKYSIISDYEKKIRNCVKLEMDPWDEPLIVEKTFPEGYMTPVQKPGPSLGLARKWGTGLTGRPNIGMKWGRGPA